MTCLDHIMVTAVTDWLARHANICGTGKTAHLSCTYEKSFPVSVSLDCNPTHLGDRKFRPFPAPSAARKGKYLLYRQQTVNS